MSCFEKVGVKCFNLIQCGFTELHSNKTVLNTKFLEFETSDEKHIYLIYFFFLTVVLTDKQKLVKTDPHSSDQLKIQCVTIIHVLSLTN